MRPALTALAVGLCASLLAGCLGPPPELSGGGFLQRPEPVVADASGLVVAGRAFVVKGVNYAPPGPNGTVADWNGHDARRDLAAMKRMGANTIRVSGVPQPALAGLLDAARVFDVKVIVTLPGPADPASVSDAEARALERELRTLLARHADHPALLLWDLGDGWDARATGDPAAWLQVLGRLAEVVAQEDPRHPAMTSTTTVEAAIAARSAAPRLGLLGVAGPPARGETLAQQVADRPILLTSFSADAWNETRDREDPPAQAASAARAWIEVREARAASGRLAGAVLAAWADRWDLEGGPRQDASSAQPDREWLGAHRFRDGAWEPRPIVATLAEAWGREADGTPPSILDLTRTRNATEARVGATVVTYGGLNASVELLYRAAGGAWAATPMTLTGPERWEAALVPADDSLVYFRVKAVDEAGRQRTTADETLRGAPLGALAAAAALALAALGRRARG